MKPWLLGVAPGPWLTPSWGVRGVVRVAVKRCSWLVTCGLRVSAGCRLEPRLHCRAPLQPRSQPPSTSAPQGVAGSGGPLLGPLSSLFSGAASTTLLLCHGPPCPGHKPHLLGESIIFILGARAGPALACQQALSTCIGE